MRRILCGTSVLLLAHAVTQAAEPEPTARAGCGAVAVISTHAGTSTRYSISMPQEKAMPAHAALVLIAGGGGDLRLDAQGCAQALESNPVVRAVPHFNANGLATALVDAPSDLPGEEGLAGFRMAQAHAEDIGKIIADMRTRTGAPVWLVGHSRGTISVANAAARLQGPQAPDGIVLMSAIMVGGGKSYVAQTVFDAALEEIRVPVLVMGHADDMCVRSPATAMDRITARTNGARERVVTLRGGAAAVGAAVSVEACGARMPHGFVNLDAEFASEIARFMRAGSY